MMKIAVVLSLQWHMTVEINSIHLMPNQLYMCHFRSAIGIAFYLFLADNPFNNLRGLSNKKCF